MHTFSTPTQSPGQAGFKSGIQGACLASSQGIGRLQKQPMGWDDRGSDADHHRWPGKSYGLRGPHSEENPLSPAEVEIALELRRLGEL